ncbi:family 78 glycoside hydrolase catalytic domain [Rathayibacter sp. VKM Ac-2857]|nr:alpha-L-rhamnosidase [Rathayibacter sp. VKM Ac-2857]NQX17341.1 family 78 glycoside hydrolase catalytic domain [Rathayibacter sp. VKM Ac-2857]
MTRSSAQLISAGAPSAKGDAAPYFRREFAVARGIVRAELTVTALGVVTPYLNGERLSDEALAPGWTSYRHRLLTSTVDVTAQISEGDNVLAGVVGEGWAVGELSWDNLRHVYSDRPAFYALLTLEYSDHVETVGTDCQFRVSTGGLRGNGIYYGEDFDARLEPHGWLLPGFDDSAWMTALPLEWDLSSLAPRTAPPIRPIEELSPREIHADDEDRFVIDFGQNISGWVRLRVTGPTGRKITLRFAELQRPDGGIEVESNRTARATDTYTLRGDGEETWEPRTTFHGFRYVEISGWPGRLDIDAIRAVVVHSDMTRTGWFQSSDPRVTKLHENVVWSMRDNFVGLPTDCPQRDERLGWTGDINAFAPTATFLYNAQPVLESWLEDVWAEQRAFGDVPWYVPMVGSTPMTPTALWSDVVVSLPWQLYLESGNVDILRRAYPGMTTLMRRIEADLDPRGLWNRGFQFGDWLDPDAPASSPSAGKTDAHLVACAFLCKTTRELAETAALLGENADAQHFFELATRVREAFRHEYVTGSGRVVNESATAYALVIVFDLLDGDQRTTAGRRLSDIVTGVGHRISTGFAGTPLVTDALSSTGYLDDAYEMLLQEQAPSYLYPVLKGATTIWERWDSVLPDGTLNSTGMTSLNHYALGAVADWLHRVVAGLARTEPGWAALAIAPRPGGGLTSASAVHDSPRGKAAVSWYLHDGTITVDAVIPEGTRASVELPFATAPEPFSVGAGTHSWTYDLPTGYGQRAHLHLGSSLREIQSDPRGRKTVSTLVQAQFPGIELDQVATSPEQTLEEILKSIPGDTTDIAEKLRAALSR